MAASARCVSREREEETPVAASAIVAAGVNAVRIYARVGSILQPEWADEHGEPALPVLVDAIKSIKSIQCSCSSTHQPLSPTSASVSAFLDIQPVTKQTSSCICPNHTIYIHITLCLRPSTAAGTTATAPESATTATSTSILTAEPCAAGQRQTTAEHCTEPGASSAAAAAAAAPKS